jgi:hypothetical protein
MCPESLQIPLANPTQHSGAVEAERDDLNRKLNVLKRKVGHHAENEGRARKRGRGRNGADSDNSDDSGSEEEELGGGKGHDKDTSAPAVQLRKAKLEARRVGKQLSLMYALLLPTHLNNDIRTLFNTDISDDSNTSDTLYTEDPDALTLKIARDLHAIVPEAHRTAGYTNLEWYAEEVCAVPLLPL